MAWLALALCGAARAEPAEDEHPPAATEQECPALARTPWPRSAPAQAALLRRMEAAAERCNRDASFLAAFGGAWLEVGDAEQAVLWLERALLLNPALEAAQADYALALAALGEPAAREELVRAWQDRADVPPVLWRRLTQTASAVAGRIARPDDPSRAAGRPTAGNGWLQVREVQLLLGHETNLAQSPRLSELTITPPDGPITLPLAEPLQPRSGAAALLDLSWQGAVSPAPRQTILFGVQASARHSPSDSDTDWNSLRLAFAASHRSGAWRWQLQGRAQFAGGPLNEDGRQVRWDLSADGPAGPCSQRWLVEADDRRYRRAPINDARSTAVAASVLCAVPGFRGWTFGISGRRADDRARSDERPGGDQRQESIALRVLADLGRNGRLGGPWVLDAQWRFGRTLDADGYSVLLENNVRRSSNSHHLLLELTGPWLDWPLSRAESVIQLVNSNQKSNLAVFSYTATSLYGGLRYRW